MKIVSGLFDQMVVQRNGQNVSDARFAGECEAQGPLLASVYHGKRVMKAFAGIKVGKAAAGRFEGRLKGLPAGGPYAIRLAAGDEKLTVRDVLVGDVWLLGGQSNMQGCGTFPDTRLPVDPLVRAFYMDDRWAPAADCIHNLWDAVDPVHVDLYGGVRHAAPVVWGVGPGPAFGLEMHRLTGVPQGLIACAHGGTSMELWDPALKDKGGKSLYGAMLRRFVKNGGRVAGLLWYQGCSDAVTASARQFSERMVAFLEAVRRDTGKKSLPVVMVQIARVMGWGGGGEESVAAWNSIQEQQRLLPQGIRNLATVPAIDLPLDDAIHIGGEGQRVLGRRLAYAMRVLQAGPEAGLPPIALKSIRTATGQRGTDDLLVEFANVEGSLCAGSRPSGFSVVGRGAHVFDVKLEGRVARLCTTVTKGALEQVSVHYGHGLDPYCNITDQAGRALPVFGPVRLEKLKAVTPFIRDWQVSAFQSSAGRLDALDYPADPAALDLRFRRFSADFCDLHGDIARLTEDAVVYYICRFNCVAPTRLALLLGYDGPVKVWGDGKMLWHDPDGTAPAAVDEARIALTAAAGGHEIMLALGTNQGAAWGIFARLQRLDISRADLRKGPAFWNLPKVAG